MRIGSGREVRSAAVGDGSTTGAIRYAVVDRVATITIDRPEKRNAMSWAVLADFRDTVARAGADPSAHVVIVTGAGGAFCAGRDLADLAQTPESVAAVDEAGHAARTADLLGERVVSDDHREGVAAFLERRDPRFTGT